MLRPLLHRRLGDTVVRRGTRPPAPLQPVRFQAELVGRDVLRGRTFVRRSQWPRIRSSLRPCSQLRFSHRFECGWRAFAGEADAIPQALSAFTMLFGSIRPRAVYGSGSGGPIRRTRIRSTVLKGYRRLPALQGHAAVRSTGWTQVAMFGCLADLRRLLVPLLPP
jgi:hypothetical protein